MSTLFNKRINERQFNFQPLEFGEEKGYHVDVKDQEGTRWEFRMFQINDKWTIDGEKLPPWIHHHDLEIALAQAIDENE